MKSREWKFKKQVIFAPIAGVGLSEHAVLCNSQKELDSVIGQCKRRNFNYVICPTEIPVEIKQKIRKLTQKSII